MAFPNPWPKSSSKLRRSFICLEASSRRRGRQLPKKSKPTNGLSSRYLELTNPATDWRRGNTVCLRLGVVGCSFAPWIASPLQIRSAGLSPRAFISSTTRLPADFAEKLYFTAYTLFTLGMGISFRTAMAGRWRLRLPHCTGFFSG